MQGLSQQGSVPTILEECGGEGWLGGVFEVFSGFPIRNNQ
jgi:hypothetical protein